VALALSKCGSVDEFRSQLEALNSSARDQANDHITAAINAVMGHATYTRVDPGGPKWGLVTGKAPLVTAYFLYPVDRQPTNWEEEEKLAYDPSVAKYFMACNGWVMNADVSTNFAEPPSNVYLRRELICWGDCVKLNYGRGPEDCPYLWDYMQRYSETCARIFHGFRIDNCHSTPIHVAEVEPNIHFMAYLIAQYSAYVESSKEGEKGLVWYGLYFICFNSRSNILQSLVMAELFTSSEEHDNLFVNRLGITSLIRGICLTCYVFSVDLTTKNVTLQSVKMQRTPTSRDDLSTDTEELPLELFAASLPDQHHLQCPMPCYTIKHTIILPPPRS